MSDVPNLSYTISKNRKYYRYRLPDGTFESLGTDPIVARRMAGELNVIRAQKASSAITIARVVDEFRPVKNRSSNSKATRDIWNMRLDRYVEWIGRMDVSQVTVRDLDALLLDKAPDYEPYRCHRLLLGELFVYAIGRGWREHALGNPAKALLPPKLARQRSVKQRRRMSAAQFAAIRSAAPEWLQLAMDLSLLVGIRRGDICELKFSDFEDGFLRYVPSKTADLPNPAAIAVRLNAPLAELLSRARALRPASDFFIHKNNSFARVGAAQSRESPTQVLPEQLSRHFRTALRKVCDCDLFAGMTDAELPTFHEIRSLCARSYRDVGWPVSRVQKLLGHADESMTEHYQGGAGVVWQEMEL